MPSKREWSRLALAWALCTSGGCHLWEDEPVRILFVGDSLTEGVVRGRHGASLELDPAGGPPGRVAAALGPGYTVVNRGLGGSTTSLWLTGPAEGSARQPIWTLLRKHHPDLAETASREALTLVDAVLDAESPDVVVVALGTNDVFLAPALGDHSPGSPEFENALLERLHQIEARIRAHDAVAVVATILPDRQHPPAIQDSISRRIEREFDRVLVIDRDFTRAGGTALLADHVHPSPAGYEVLGGAYLRGLAELDVVELSRPTLLAPSPTGH